VTDAQLAERSELAARIAALITREHAEPGERDALGLDLYDHQRRYVAPYARFAAQRRTARAGEALDSVPALPTDAFRFARINALPERPDERVFESSGTTQEARSRHAFQSLTLYDLAAERAARRLLFPDVARMRLVIVAPPSEEMPSSSLSYMLSRFITWFGSAGSEHVFPVDGPHVATLCDALSRDGEPLALLGTSFAFVHAMDSLGARRFALPAGSRIMQTGGFKGRAREIAPDAMRAWLSHTFGVPEAMIVAEYGMTELSSQLYESTLRDAVLGQPMGPRRLMAPHWLRAVAVDPETLAPVPDGARGLVRLDDLANLDSVMAIQTADLGEPCAGGLVLHGRAQGAVARGCSITADELLTRGAG
jgi:Acyl-protein synthetase, LuxE